MKKKHRAGQALRIAASTLYHSKSELGDFFRRKQAKGRPFKSNTGNGHQNSHQHLYDDQKQNPLPTRKNENSPRQIQRSPN